MIHCEIMKKLIVLSSAAVMLLAGCKATEENYRKAYNTTVAGNVAAANERGDSIDTAIHNKIVEAMSAKPTKVGDMTVDVLTENTWQAYNQEKNAMKKYSVVVGAMRQLFNAKALCSRLEGAGCPAYVTVNGSRNYYIVAAGFDTLEEAAAYIADIKKHIPFKLPVEKPFVCNTIRL